MLFVYGDGINVSWAIDYLYVKSGLHQLDQLIINSFNQVWLCKLCLISRGRINGQNQKYALLLNLYNLIQIKCSIVFEGMTKKPTPKRILFNLSDIIPKRFRYEFQFQPKLFRLRLDGKCVQYLLKYINKDFIRKIQKEEGLSLKIMIFVEIYQKLLGVGK